MAKKARILIVNNESTYTKDLEKTVKDHADGKAETDTVHVKDAKSKIKSDDVPGRAATYEAILKGDAIRNPNIPASFNLLVNELKSLGLSIEIKEKIRDKKA